MICLIVFKSVTHAQRAASILKQAGIFTTMVRAQAVLGGGSCSYALKFKADNHMRAMELLNRGAVPYKKIYTANALGGFTEIR